MRNIIKSLIFVSALLLSACCQQKTPGVYNVLDYGAVGDGITDDAVAIQKAIDECSANGGGQVIFPSGKTFISGPVELKSNVDYHLEINSVWRANPD